MAVLKKRSEEERIQTSTMLRKFIRIRHNRRTRILTSKISDDLISIPESNKKTHILARASVWFLVEVMYDISAM